MLDHIPSGYHAENADEAFKITLDAIMKSGTELVAGKSQSTGSEKASRELINFSIVMKNSRERVLWTEHRRLNLPAAVARFVWMMAGSDRLADIAFYEPKVRAFTDDEVSVPGSNYGQRMLQARPGLNQLTGTISRLREDVASRRAAISIFHPEDAVRDSRDIPCTFGLFYHVRNGALHATTIMRSNNASVLLPYNLFEFSLLAEVVAKEVGVDLGPLTHFAGSMHVYEYAYDLARKLANHGSVAAQAPVPEMPSLPSPLSEIQQLVILEAELRHGSAALGISNIQDWICKGEDNLSPYWRQYFFLLLAHVAIQNGDAPCYSELYAVLEEPWRSLVSANQADGTTREEEFQLELPPRIDSGKVIPIVQTRAHKVLRGRIAEWEDVNTEAEPLVWREFVYLEEQYASKLAARDGEDLTVEELTAAIEEMRSGNKYSN